MNRANIAACALALTAAAGLLSGPPIRVLAGQQETRPIPEWARAVSMYAPASSAPNEIIIDVPANNTIYPPDIIPPQFAVARRQPRRHHLAHRNPFRQRPPHPHLVKR